MLAPTIFFLGLTVGVRQPDRCCPASTPTSYQSFIIPVSLLQGAGFTGAATGVNLARDIEQGWFDRLLASPAPRPVLLAGMVLSASLRALIPADRPARRRLRDRRRLARLRRPAARRLLRDGDGDGRRLLGRRRSRSSYKTQSAAPLMQAGMFILVLFTTAYAPLELLQGWLADIARINPVTQVVEAARQGFIGAADHLGRDLAGARRPRRAARRAQRRSSPCAGMRRAPSY